MRHVVRAAQRAQSCGSHPDPSRAERWYCFRTLMGQHAEAVARLDEQAFTTFFPLFRTRRPSSKIDIRALFPRYGFVRFDITSARWRLICSTRGVEAILGSHPERPTPIPTGTIEGLLAQLSPAGWIDDPDLQPTAIPIEPGVTVRVTSGPFTSFHGICKWSTSKRLTVLLDLFSGPTEVTLRRSMVETT